jgi:hypothetical protein
MICNLHPQAGSAGKRRTASLFGLTVRPVTTTPPAVFGQLQAVRIILAILAGRIIPALALITGHIDDETILF